VPDALYSDGIDVFFKAFINQMRGFSIVDVTIYVV
jgi:hypothetical protein